MKVRFLTLSMGPRGMIRPGDVVDVPAGEAKLLLAGKYAEPVEPAEQKPDKEEAPKDVRGNEPAGGGAGHAGRRKGPSKNQSR